MALAHRNIPAHIYLLFIVYMKCMRKLLHEAIKILFGPPLLNQIGHVAALRHITLHSNFAKPF